jgi:hypothetical protein
MSRRGLGGVIDAENRSAPYLPRASRIWPRLRSLSAREIDAASRRPKHRACGFNGEHCRVLVYGCGSTTTFLPAIAGQADKQWAMRSTAARSCSVVRRRTATRPGVTGLGTADMADASVGRRGGTRRARGDRRLVDPCGATAAPTGRIGELTRGSPRCGIEKSVAWPRTAVRRCYCRGKSGRGPVPSCMSKAVSGAVAFHGPAVKRNHSYRTPRGAAKPF